MKSIDSHYLSLQFFQKAYTKNGKEFQSFFEDIMQKRYSDFEKVKPYGNKGDGGNDGFRKEVGIYYQIYSPEDSTINHNKAVTKLNKDFENLKTTWGSFSQINEFYFVFNDKNLGTSTVIEQALAKLMSDNPTIKFGLFVTKNLEVEFQSLNETDLVSLGLIVDQRESLKILGSYLQTIDDEIEKENALSASSILNKSEQLIQASGNDSLINESDLLKARCLKKLEKVDEAKNLLESMFIRYPKDIRSLLYLAEIYLQKKDFNKNLELLDQAKGIDPKNPLIEIFELVRNRHIKQTIDLAKIDENNFPSDVSIKANLYRLYSLFYADEGMLVEARSFIEKSIRLKEIKFNSHIAKLDLIELQMSNKGSKEEINALCDVLWKEIAIIEDNFSGIGPRNIATLNLKRLNILRFREKFAEFQDLAAKTFNHLITCHFDSQIEQLLTKILMLTVLDDTYLAKLVAKIEEADLQISELFAKVLIIQFIMHNILFTKGKKFFGSTKNSVFQSLIHNIENKNYQEVLDFVKDDPEFGVSLAIYLTDATELRKEIIEQLPPSIPKQKLLILLHFDNNNYDEAFKIIQALDINSLNISECYPILKVVQEKKAWDFAVVILKKLLVSESDAKKKFYLTVDLFYSNLELKNYSEVIHLGNILLSDKNAHLYMNNPNYEAVLNNTLFAYLEKGR